ncbi:hypothetical protein [Algoriphagus sp.]|uniref:hypothetical protein n=1 Tax=Algoriphagus sp. TaxID=1872435 RepID=UPI0032999534
MLHSADDDRHHSLILNNSPVNTEAVREKKCPNPQIGFLGFRGYRRSTAAMPSSSGNE